jgi:hypothetical protein
MKKVQNMAHQGDVFMIRVSDDITPNGKSLALKNGEITLVEGEATGHHHMFRNNADIAIFEEAPISEKVKNYLVKVKKEAKFEHYNVNTKELTKEHDTIVVPAGNWVFGTQRELDHEGDLIRALD